VARASLISLFVAVNKFIEEHFVHGKGSDPGHVWTWGLRGKKVGVWKALTSIREKGSKNVEVTFSSLQTRKRGIVLQYLLLPITMPVIVPEVCFSGDKCYETFLGGFHGQKGLGSTAHPLLS
jgi:hypothetical protein